jgi:hypothetical protein
MMSPMNETESPGEHSAAPPAGDAATGLDAAGPSSEEKTLGMLCHLNFQITVSIACIVCIPLIFICIGIVLLIAIAVANLILVIVAAINAAGGTAYRYPMTWRLVK